MKWFHVLVGVLAGAAVGYAVGKRQCDDMAYKDGCYDGFDSGYEYANSLRDEPVNTAMADAFMDIFGYARKDEVK